MSNQFIVWACVICVFSLLIVAIIVWSIQEKKNKKLEKELKREVNEKLALFHELEKLKRSLIPQEKSIIKSIVIDYENNLPKTYVSNTLAAFPKAVTNAVIN